MNLTVSGDGDGRAGAHHGGLCGAGAGTAQASYKENFNRLRDLKKEIEHLQLLLEQSRHALQGDFEKWCAHARNVPASEKTTFQS